MLALALDTARRALRARGLWILLSLGLLAGWGGLSLAILALGQAERQAVELLQGTALTWAALIAAWVLARSLDADQLSDLGPVLDAAAPGEAGRILGRWMGSTVVGGIAGLSLAVALSPATGIAGIPLSLLYASIISAGFLSTWTLLLAGLFKPGVAFGFGLALWVLGHLPWGSPALLPGATGRALGAVLPGPQADPGAALLLIAGLLLVAAATTRTGSMLRSSGGGRSPVMG